MSTPLRFEQCLGKCKHAAVLICTTTTLRAKLAHTESQSNILLDVHKRNLKVIGAAFRYSVYL